MKLKWLDFGTGQMARVEANISITIGLDPCINEPSGYKRWLLTCRAVGIVGYPLKGEKYFQSIEAVKGEALDIVYAKLQQSRDRTVVAIEAIEKYKEKANAANRSGNTRP